VLTNYWRESRKQLLQFRVLRLGLLRDGDVGVGVLPEREEVLIKTRVCPEKANIPEKALAKADLVREQTRR
jgi:hypothetical protein